MRNVIMVLGVLALGAATPAAADTLKEVTTHGIILTLGDMDIPVDYTPDGKLSAMDGAVTGTWRIDGDKLCTTSNVDLTERCVAYPKDKKSGDSFVITGEQGSVTIKIR
jgi:hypothetical protein